MIRQTLVVVAQWPKPEEMGQGLSCNRSDHEREFFTIVQSDDAEVVFSALTSEPAMLHQATLYDRLFSHHLAAANGRLEVLSMLLDRSVHHDLLNWHKQTPLMLTAMQDKIACVKKLLKILMFDSLHGRTCLHYAAYRGYSDCLQAMLLTANSTPIVDSWGFVNVRDGTGATSLHLAARQRRPECVHLLPDSGALISTSTGVVPGAPLCTWHLMGGCLDCVRELLA